MDKPQRSHISTIILGVIKYIKSNFIFIFLIFTHFEFPLSIFISIALFILMIIFSTIVWYNKKFYLKENVLHYEIGIINKKRLTLSKDKISTLDIEQKFFQRFLGVYRLKVDSGSTDFGKTEIDIVLNKKYIEELKNSLENIEDSSKVHSTIKEEEKFREVFNSENKEIFLLALTKSKLGLVITLVTSSVIFLDEISNILNILKVNIDADSYFDKYFKMETLMEKSIIALFLFMLQLFVVVYIISSILYVLVTFIKYFNFKIFKENDKINIQYGLINLKKYSLPIENIQAIRLKQNILNQWLNQYRVEVITAGYGNENKEEAIFYPLADKNRLKTIIENLIPEFKFEDIEKSSPPKKSMKRFFILPITFSTIFFLGLTLVFHQAALLFITLPIIAFECYLNYKNTAMGYDKNIFYGNFGSFGKTTFIIKMASVQSITETSNYFQRKIDVRNYKIDFYSNKLTDIMILKNLEKTHFLKIEENLEF